MKIDVKPLSVNRAWQGRRFKTKEYKSYETAVMLRLRPIPDFPDGKLNLIIDVGFSNKSADLDNVLKPFIDITQKKYGYNDSQIYAINAFKNIVPKGQEYIDFKIEGL